jgi:outer membrane protein OmpA-like peptidoglycan-associated protein
MQGSVDSNMGLSRARAAAVVDALIKQHAVKRERLGSEGVGPYAPLSNNTSDAGRAKNRRVEMVLR